jgi:serum/glucocorticoid-regulated kinase 2
MKAKPLATLSIYSQSTLIGSTIIKPSFLDLEMEDRWYNLQILTASIPDISMDALAQFESVKASFEDGRKPIPPPLPPGRKIVGQIHIQVCWKPTPPRITLEDFSLLKTLGKGSYGQVILAVKRDTGRFYAMKCIKKTCLVGDDGKNVQHTWAERDILTIILPRLEKTNPFIVPLKWCFQSDSRLFFVLNYINGGELFHHLQQQGKFTESSARFYAAELLSVLETLHGCGIIYRDLKPENILLDANGHISVCDFGLCKIIQPDDGNQLKTSSFCGTPSYMAPEVLQSKEYSQLVDYWTLGVLLYEMIYGIPPFWSESEAIMYNQILHAPLVFDESIAATDLVTDLMNGLLQKDPSKRLGKGGIQEIKRHVFFADIDWETLLAKGYEPPFKPFVMGPSDTSMFDPEFTNLPPLVGSSEALPAPPAGMFKDFSFTVSEM